MPIQPNGPAPYTPAATILSVVDRARDRGLPNPVSKDVLIRSGVAETLVPRTFHALQLLELINEEGAWTENLESLRRAPESELQTRFAEIVRVVYGDAFQYIDPSKDSATAIRDAFRSYKPHGQQERMVMLFLGLCQRAGILTEESPAKVASREVRPKSRVISMTPQTKPKPKSKPDASAPAIGNGNLPPPLAGLLATLPQSGWTKNERERFVTAFNAMLDYVIPIRAESTLEEERE
jgi:hypothetical protein